MKDFQVLSDIIYYQRANYPKSNAFNFKVGGQWQATSSDDFIKTALQISKSLLKSGIKADDKIALISPNRPEWNMVDQGILQIGAVNVPIYPTISEHEYRFIFNDAGIRIAFVADKGLFQKINAIKADVPTLEAIYSFEKVEGCKHISEFLEMGSSINDAQVSELRAAVKPEQLATIIYTSGTTGTPKGVMLSHNNVVSNIKAVLPQLPLGPQKVTLSFLPLCHIFERVVIYAYMATGVSVFYAESMETIADNLKEVKPNFFTTVPRLLEKVYMKLEAKGQDLDGWKKNLYYNALEFANDFDPDKDYSFLDKIKRKVYDKLIYSKWREALGGNVEGICSGAAALNPRLARVFTCAGVLICEGYGQTESSPVISVTPFNIDKVKFGTVGVVIPGVEVKLDEKSGEILAKGPNVMMGYYNRPDLTAETVVDGWLKTGDVGSFVEYKGEKYLKITDRVKELFKTSGGKYVAPQSIENKMKEIPFIEQIMVVGENRNFVTALIVPNFLNLADWCTKNNIAAKTPEEMVKSPEVQKLYRDAIDEKNKNFGQWETVKKFELLAKEWSIDTGELTPTMKVKRKVVNERYLDVIEKLYNQA